LNDLISVRDFAQKFKYEKIDLLLNNAGIMTLPEREVTIQGYEKQVGVNHLGHFHLTNLLLNKIKASSEGRIVSVSSLAHEGNMGPKTIDFNDLWSKDSYDPMKAYFYSKLCNVYFTRYLAKILEKEGVKNVKCCSLHPGVVRTELSRYLIGDSIIKKILF